MASILLINGPNLNLLGQREPEVYGSATLTDIENLCTEMAQENGHELQCFQSNAEHEIITKIQAVNQDSIDLIIMNPAAFSHTSIAIRDALLAMSCPVIEVHLSNPHTREPFRHTNYISDVAMGVICGFGLESYRLAMQAAIGFLKEATRTN